MHIVYFCCKLSTDFTHFLGILIFTRETQPGDYPSAREATLVVRYGYMDYKNHLISQTSITIR